MTKNSRNNTENNILQQRMECQRVLNLMLQKKNLSANEACENMTKNSRNNTEKSYSTRENGMPEGLKFDAFLSYFFVKKISLSRCVEYVVDGSMDQ